MSQRSAVVTGAASGIGRAVAGRLHAFGGSPIGNSRVKQEDLGSR